VGHLLNSARICCCKALFQRYNLIAWVINCGAQHLSSGWTLLNACIGIDFEASYYRLGLCGYDTLGLQWLCRRNSEKLGCEENHEDQYKLLCNQM
jgi:hypothetical protein